MKHLIAILLIAVMAFAQSDTREFKPTFCTTVLGIDYCDEEDITVRVNFKSNNRIVIYGNRSAIVDMKVSGKWKHLDSGDSSVTVVYDGDIWTLTVTPRSYVLDNHTCSYFEFWKGSRKSQHKQHEYVQIYGDDLSSFEDRCIDEYSRTPKKAKSLKKMENFFALNNRG